MTRADPLDAARDPIAEQAAHWIVRLSDGDQAARERTRAAFEAWKRADPRHAAEAETMEFLIDRMHGLRTATAGDSRPARATLDALQTHQERRRRRKRLAVSLVLALVLCLPLARLLTVASPMYWLADLRTSAGQWETHTLPDGTRISLDSGSAVNLHYDAAPH